MSMIDKNHFYFEGYKNNLRVNMLKEDNIIFQLKKLQDSTFRSIIDRTRILVIVSFIDQ